MRHLLTSLAMVAAVATTAQAQDYPTRTVTLVVPAAPGGPSDAMARVLAEQLKTSLGQNVVVENRGGANGMIGVASVVRAPADGHQVLFSVDGPITTLPSLAKNVGYDATRDLTPAAVVGDGGDVVLAVRADSPVRSPRELADALRKDPASANYVSSGAGFPSHIVGELFKREGKFNAQHVPVRGAGAAMNELLSGRYSFSFPPASLAAVHERAGKIRVLAVAARQRNQLFPDTPTLAEAGFTGVTPPGYWIAMYVPAETPAPVVERLGNATREATRGPAFGELLKKQGMVASTATTPQIAARVRSESDYWRDTLEKLDIKVE